MDLTYIDLFLPNEWKYQVITVDGNILFFTHKPFFNSRLNSWRCRTEGECSYGFGFSNNIIRNWNKTKNWKYILRNLGNHCNKKVSIGIYLDKLKHKWFVMQPCGNLYLFENQPDRPSNIWWDINSELEINCNDRLLKLNPQLFTPQKLIY